MYSPSRIMAWSEEKVQGVRRSRLMTLAAALRGLGSVRAKDRRPRRQIMLNSLPADAWPDGAGARSRCLK